MEFTVSGKALLGMLSTVLLGVASWFILGHIEYGNRIARLESSAISDARQDAELAEIRATMRDLIRLESANHAVSAPPFVPTAVMITPPAFDDAMGMDAPAGPEPEMEEPAPSLTEYDRFRTEQADLESVLRSRGIEPTSKPILDPRKLKR